MKLNGTIVQALHNSGYRYLGRTGSAYSFAKPLAYAILRADVYDDNTTVDVLLVVKDNKKDDGQKSNLIWKSARRGIIALPGEDLYLSYVQAIADCETDIFLGSPVAIPGNRGVRYDFTENLDISVDED